MMNSKKRTIPEIFTSISPKISAANPPPKITVSTLKGFQLLDSSSDDISSSDEEDGESWRHSPQANSSSLHLSNDASIPCPALDEMFEEYFENEKENAAEKMYNSGACVQNSTKKFGKNHHMIEGGTPRPYHLYFSATDVRIRDLVRSRLPNFSPLDDSANTSVRPPGADIDYMSQFAKIEDSSMSQQTTRKGEKKKKRKDSAGRSKSKIQKTEGKCPAKSMRLSSGPKFIEEQSSVDPISWLTPKSDSKPMNAGKRRVHAGRSSGFWYTEHGRKVYVTTTGEELSGKSAYMKYKKENQLKFNNGSKKKKPGPKQKKK